MAFSLISLQEAGDDSNNETKEVKGHDLALNPAFYNNIHGDGIIKATSMG